VTIQEVGDILRQHSKSWLPVDRGTGTRQVWEHPVHGILYVRQAPWDVHYLQFMKPSGKGAFAFLLQ
jgi:hypothetical protein